MKCKCACAGKMVWSPLLTGFILLTGGLPSMNAAEIAPRVDFSYAFATPHRLTVARPDSSDKTLLDLQPGYLRMAWTYGDLTHYPLAAYMKPKTNWDIRFSPKVDDHAFAKSTWTRVGGYLPMLENVYEDNGVRMELQVIGAATAALVQVQITNPSNVPHRVTLHCNSMSWGENPAWVDPARWVGDNLVAGQNERADRVLILGLGADAYSVQGDNAHNFLMVWDVKPGETRTGWVVRPYHGYTADLPKLRKRDWVKEVEQAKTEWHTLLNRACQISIPDPGVQTAFRACLADLFIMREPVAGGYLAAIPGTEAYRAMAEGEAAIAAVALDQFGYHKESAAGFQVNLDIQEADGNWDDPHGWGHLMWADSGFKAWAAMTHFRLTGDRKYLAKVYPRLVASSRWQEQERARMRVLTGAERPLTYGLMPRGMGDGGLMNDDDQYGVFLPHNIWAVYADRCSVEAAEILGKTKDLPELRKIFQVANEDLLQALERGAIPENDYRWLPGVSGKTSGSLFGGLNALFPCGLLPADHPLITGTIRHMEARLSKGGLPIHTGWMKNGMWVAITLDNLAEAHLARGNGDAAARYLYATLNHGTPLYTWCEERGQEPGAKECSGDRQHLWTPVAVVRAIRDSLVMEQADGLHLALGTDRAWLASGNPVGIADAPTHFGRISYSLRYDAASGRITGEATFPKESSLAKATLHVRLPGKDQVLTWLSPRGKIKIDAAID